jgi:aryl-phospho-beta-D-glucosidase BglC (GH1 family)
MKMNYTLLAILTLLFPACGNRIESNVAEADAPRLVSTSPKDGADGITAASLSVVFTYDQIIKSPLEARQRVSVDGGAAVEKVEVYEKDLMVSLTGLTRGSRYTLFLPEGTVQGFKHNQKGSAAVQFHFSTREPDPENPDPEGWEKAAVAVVNMGVGWNLGNTLDANSGGVDNMWIEAFTDRAPADYEKAWGQPLATRELIHLFKEAGFGAIRVPVTWYPHMGSVKVTVIDNHGHWDMSTWNGFDVDPAWMARVKEVVSYVLDEGMYCILNVHHDTGDASTAWLRADPTTYASVRERYCALWEQIAVAFKPYGPRLIFESFNEMLDAKGTWNASTDAAHETINRYNADFVATVRETGGNNTWRNLILNTYAASTHPEALRSFRLPADTAEGHLMAEVHSYAPYHFAFDGTFAPKTVFDEAAEKEVKDIVENINTYLVSKGIPCVLGEYGCTSNRAETEMAKQAACYISATAKYNIPCFYWMGLSDGNDRTVPKWTKPVLKDAILKAYLDSKGH